ncbi:MAG: NAD(P)/FAD-dependent oxidoreductase [Bacteroidetes bacterium]|nr:NAD(P)/FAD-dependent oxidoreductase [Bacteroidota bacterium]
MNAPQHYDVIIIGGSYGGMAAGMALGRALRRVLIIDAGLPSNRMTPHSHNFLTHDGATPGEIARIAREQLMAYATVETVKDVAVHAERTSAGFQIETMCGNMFTATKLVFATGITDIMMNIEGFKECWGRSVLHCPYCHGYEVRQHRTGVIANGTSGFEYVLLIANWTSTLTLFTNGASTLTDEQTGECRSRGIEIVETPITSIEHTNGQVRGLVLEDGDHVDVDVVYAKCAFEQHCIIPAMLGCEHDADGYISVDARQHTSIEGVYACGDNTSPMRTVANAVASGTATGMHVNKELVMQGYVRLAT